MVYSGRKCQYKTYAESTSKESKQWLYQLGIDKDKCIICTGYLGYVNCDKFKPEFEGGLIELIKSIGKY
jgi:hypothetical protein